MVIILKYLFYFVHSMVSAHGKNLRKSSISHKDKDIDRWGLEWISLAARNIEILGKIEV